MKTDIANIFSFFIKKVNGYAPELSEKTLDSFIKGLGKYYDLNSLGNWFWWSYFAYQFTYWCDKKTRFDGKIMPNWVLGPKAIQRFQERDENWTYYVSEWLRNTDIELPIEYCQEDVSEIWEVERRRFYNTELGYAHCQDCSVYKEKSLSCIMCKWKKRCSKK